MIGTLSIKCNSAHPEIALPTIFAFTNSPSSIRVIDVPKKIGDWSITSVQFRAIWPDASTTITNCVSIGGSWIGTIQGTEATGSVKNGFAIVANGTDEYGAPVNGYVLGVGDIQVSEPDVEIKGDEQFSLMKLYDETPSNPKQGNLYKDGDDYVIWQNGEANAIGVTHAELETKASKSELNSYCKKSDVTAPTTSPAGSGRPSDAYRTGLEIDKRMLFEQPTVGWSPVTFKAYADNDNGQGFCLNGAYYVLPYDYQPGADNGGTIALTKNTYTKSEVDSELALKADNSDLETLEGVVDGKLSKSGDEMTGNLTMTNQGKIVFGSMPQTGSGGYYIDYRGFYGHYDGSSTVNWISLPQKFGTIALKSDATLQTQNEYTEWVVNPPTTEGEPIQLEYDEIHHGWVPYINTVAGKVNLGLPLGNLDSTSITWTPQSSTINATATRQATGRNGYMIGEFQPTKLVMPVKDCYTKAEVDAIIQQLKTDNGLV